MEEFRKIQNYNYSVSNLGNVRNDKFNRILTNVIDSSSGYYVVSLCNNSKTKNIRVHKLIADAFIPNPNNKPCVDHKNNNKLDNNISNLRWCTSQENNRNKSMYCNNSSGYKGVTFDKKANKWRAQITIDGIQIHLGYYDTIEEATIARVNKVNQVFGQYKNSCEGINFGAKPKKIRKSKKIIQPIVNQTVQPIVKMNVQQIYNDIDTLKNNYKNGLLNLQKALQIELMNM